MNRKNRILSLVLAILMMLSLVACGSDEKGNAVGSPVGELIDTEYTNNRFLIRCKLPEDWIAATKEERAALIGLAASAANSEDFDKLMEQAGTWCELYASSADDTARIIITVEKAGPMAAMSYTPKAFLDGMVDTYVKSLENNGLTDVTSERGVKDFMDGEREYLKLSGISGENAIFMEYFIFKSSRYYCTITLSSLGTDQISDVEAMFSEVKDLNYQQ